MSTQYGLQYGEGPVVPFETREAAQDSLDRHWPHDTVWLVREVSDWTQV